MIHDGSCFYFESANLPNSNKKVQTASNNIKNSTHLLHEKSPLPGHSPRIEDNIKTKAATKDKNNLAVQQQIS